MAESFIEKLTYVIRVSRKPTEKEVTENLKIVLIGILIMGAIGFTISLLFKLME